MFLHHSILVNASTLNNTAKPKNDPQKRMKISTATFLQRGQDAQHVTRQQSQSTEDHKL